MNKRLLHTPLTRRSFVLGGAGAGALYALGLRPSTASQTANRVVLRAEPATAALVGPPYNDTSVWSYNGAVPGSEIRLRQGERLQVEVSNQLEQETTVHWHGLRIANAMDGVPGLTQEPIKPGESFVYDFTVPDAGTYWYHPHLRSFEQVGRGLYGPLIVEEKQPITVDRDLTWVLDDWRLTRAAQISDDFGQFHDLSHAGRIGNTVTVNGRIPKTFAVRAGERLRLRLINAANARTFALDFEGHEPRIIAIDGQPVEPHQPEGGLLVLGAAMRMDIVLDMAAKPGAVSTVTDRAYRNREYHLLDLVYENTPPLREQPLDASIRLPPNPLPEPDLAGAERHRIEFQGGAMGRMQGAMLDGDWTEIRAMAQRGKMWAVNGVAATGPMMEPVLTLQKDRSYVLELHNNTGWQHPIHLHGHAFRVLARDGRPTRHREWQDTVLMDASERVDIAFVADNPGDWMFHCHILEHQAAGMSAVVRVA